MQTTKAATIICNHIVLKRVVVEESAPRLKVSILNFRSIGQSHESKCRFFTANSKKEMYLNWREGSKMFSFERHSNEWVFARPLHATG